MKPYYEHGGITIYHADATEIPEHLSRGTIFCCDPPYSRAGAASSGRTSTAGRSSEINASDQFWYSWFLGVAHRLGYTTSHAGCGFVFCDYRTIHLIERAFNHDAQGWTLSQGLIWNRMAMGLGSPFRASHEMIAFVRGPRFDYAGPKNIRNVFDYRWVYGEHEHHSAEKPVALIRDLLSYVTTSTDTVVDHFMGSGTTLLACQRLGLKAIGIEMEERYCEIAAQRLGQEVLDLGGAA